MTIVNIATFRAKDGMGQALGSALAKVVPLTRQEPGCLRYDLLSNEENEWVMIEFWENEEAIAEHLAQPYIIEVLGKLDELLSGEPEVKSYCHSK